MKGSNSSGSTQMFSGRVDFSIFTVKPRLV